MWNYQYMSNYFSTAGEYDQAIASAHRALALATSSNDFGGQVATHNQLGRFYCHVGDYHQALEELQWTITMLTGDQLYTHYGMAALSSVVCRALSAWCHAELGDFAEGRTIGEEGVRIAESIDNPFNRIVAYHGIGRLALRQGDIDLAVAMLEQSFTICEATQNALFLYLSASDLAVAYAHAKRSTEALSLLDQVVDQVTSEAPMTNQALLMNNLSEVYLRLGRLEEATQLAERSLDLSRERRQRSVEAQILWSLSDIARHCDSPEVDEAITFGHQALALASDLGMRPLQAHCHRSLGTLYHQTGQLEPARAEWSAAIALYREMGMAFWLPETVASLAAVEER